jgi:phage FluMu protein Com
MKNHSKDIVAIRCRVCRCRSNFRPKILVKDGHKYFFVKCPKCLSEGEVRLKKKLPSNNVTSSHD